MLSWEELRQIRDEHFRNKPIEKMLQKLARDNPGTTEEYWRGYWYGVLFGYDRVLKK